MIKILGCSHPSYWWSKQRGKTFLALLYRPESDDFLLDNGECILAQDVEATDPR